MTRSVRGLFLVIILSANEMIFLPARARTGTFYFIFSDTTPPAYSRPNYKIRARDPNLVFIACIPAVVVVV